MVRHTVQVVQVASLPLAEQPDSQRGNLTRPHPDNRSLHEGYNYVGLREAAAEPSIARIGNSAASCGPRKSFLL